MPIEKPCLDCDSIVTFPNLATPPAPTAVSQCF